MFIEPELLVLAASGALTIAATVIDRFKLAKKVTELETRKKKQRSQAQEEPVIIVESSGSPYREAGVVLADVAEPEEKKEGSTIDLSVYDEHGRLKWKGPDEFMCQACGNTETDNRISFCTGKNSRNDIVGTCNKEKSVHLHVMCKKCKAVHTFGMMHLEREQ